MRFWQLSRELGAILTASCSTDESTKGSLTPPKTFQKTASFIGDAEKDPLGMDGGSRKPQSYMHIYLDRYIATGHMSRRVGGEGGKDSN